MLPSIARAVVVSVVVLAGCQRPTAGDVTPVEPVDTSGLRQTLATHRAAQIERLHAYGVAGEFPHNFTTAPSLHMFRDGGGRLCAVANLVHQDGRDDLVEATVRTRNDLAIADVHDGAMMDWVLASGLTQEELVAIQLPAPPITQRRPVPRNLPVAKKEQPAPAVPVIDPPGAIPQVQMDAIVRAHVAQVEAELRAKTDASLDLAVARYMAAHASS
jgi:hypothetical protein